jgi:hypothetical protein
MSGCDSILVSELIMLRTKPGVRSYHVFIMFLYVFICFYMFLYVFICFYMFLYVFICFYMFLYVFVCLYRTY